MSLRLAVLVLSPAFAAGRVINGLCHGSVDNTFTAKVNLFASEFGKSCKTLYVIAAIMAATCILTPQFRAPHTRTGYYQFEECGDMVNPTLALEIGETYTFIQADRSNYMVSTKVHARCFAQGIADDTLLVNRYSLYTGLFDSHPLSTPLDLRTFLVAPMSTSPSWSPPSRPMELGRALPMPRARPPCTLSTMSTLVPTRTFPMSNPLRQTKKTLAWVVTSLSFSIPFPFGHEGSSPSNSTLTMNRIRKISFTFAT